MADLQIDTISISGLTSCHLRRSIRAKRIRIELRPDHSLLIVVPAAAREDQWLAFVLSKRRWIERNLQRSARHRPGLAPGVLGFPDDIELLYSGQKYQLCRFQGSRASTKVTEDRLKLVCVESSDKHAYQVLRRWLVGQAREEFSARLEQLSGATGLKWNGLSIRGQKTRWGSCSAKGNISLNFKMLFLPANLVDHVLLHELVHTRELNHSRRFWALMQQYDQQCNLHRAELRKAGQLLPEWLANV